MNVCVIFNPTARGEKARRFRSQLDRLARECHLRPTDMPGGGRALAESAVREGFTTIVAAGGDGTLNEVLNGIGDVADGFSRVRLGLLPLGTVNVFAKELGLPTRFEAAWRIIENGQESTLDLPVAEFQKNGATVRRYFAQLAGAGFDSHAIGLVDWEAKKRLGAAAYFMAGVKALKGRLPLVKVSNGEEEARGEWIIIGNGRYYGGRWTLFPLADLRDGILEVTVFPRVNWEAMMRCGWALIARSLHEQGGIRHFRGSTIELSGEEAVPLELEGENVGWLPARLTVAPRALRVIVP